MLLTRYGGFLLAINITLSQEDISRAEQEAQRRQRHNEQLKLKGRNRAHSSGEKALELHRLGCIGEIAVASHLGIKDAVFSQKDAVRGSADLPGNIEVKTRPKHNYDLLIQLDDDPSKVFVLVTHQDGDTRIIGWAYGKDVMKSIWVREFVRGRPCYAVPQKALKCITTLAESRDQSIGDEVVPESLEASVQECENGDLMLVFDHSLEALLGWEVGDKLDWIQSEDCRSFVLRRVNE